MRRLSIVLSLTTVIFAASTLYFARELARARERPTSVPPPSTAVNRSDVRVPAPNAAARNDNSAPTVPVTAADPDAEGLDPMELAKRSMAATAEQALTELLDATRRRELLDQSKAAYRGIYPNLAHLLHLSDTEYDQLLELLAEQQLATREMMLRCSLDKNCRFPGVDRAYRDAQTLEVAALIGTDRQAQFDKFQRSLNERRGVTQLRGRLPDKDHLSDAQAELLISAVADEHQRYEAEIEQRGAGVSGYSMGGFSFVLSSEEAGAEKRLADASEYSRKLRERAARILTAGQLAVFDEMQAEAIRNLQFSLREDDRRRASPDR